MASCAGGAWSCTLPWEESERRLRITESIQKVGRFTKQSTYQCLAEICEGEWLEMNLKDEWFKTSLTVDLLTANALSSFSLLLSWMSHAVVVFCNQSSICQKIPKPCSNKLRFYQTPTDSTPSGPLPFRILKCRKNLKLDSQLRKHSRAKTKQERIIFGSLVTKSPTSSKSTSNLVSIETFFRVSDDFWRKQKTYSTFQCDGAESEGARMLRMLVFGGPEAHRAFGKKRKQTDMSLKLNIDHPIPSFGLEENKTVGRNSPINALAPPRRRAAPSINSLDLLKKPRKTK